MKASIYLFALFLTCMLFLSASCTKEENSCVQKNDCNILEWKVDGKKYKAECESGPLFGCDPADCEYYHDISSLYIVGSKIGGTGIVIYKYRNLSINDNLIKEEDYMRFVNNENERGCKPYKTDTTNQYLLSIIDIDTINKIIEGEFLFTGVNDCEDTTKVTDGYFKLSYRP